MFTRLWVLALVPFVASCATPEDAEPSASGVAPAFQVAAPGTIPIDAAAPCLDALQAAGEATRSPRAISFIMSPPTAGAPAPSCTALAVRVDATGKVGSLRQVGTGSGDPKIDAYAQTAIRGLRFQANDAGAAEFGLAIVMQPRGGDPPAVAAVDETGIVARWPAMRPVTPGERSGYLSACRHDLDTIRAAYGTAPPELPRIRVEGPAFYPPILKRLGTEGCAVLALRINPAGVVEAAQVVSQYPPDGGLGAGAAAGFRSSIFESPGPATVTVHTSVTFEK